MGRGDDGELIPSDQEVAAAEAQTRRILARWGEPTASEPPVALAARVNARINTRAPYLRRFVQAFGVAAVLLLLVGLVFGSWGVFGSSLELATRFGGPESPLGGAFLVLILITKPMVNLVAADAVLIPLGLGLSLAIFWLWWRMVRVGPRPEVP